MSLLGLLFSTLTGLILAGFYTLNKKASRTGKSLPVIFWIFAAHIPVFLVWRLITGDTHVDPIYFLPGSGVVALSLAGNILTIRAISLSPFSLMIPILGLSPVFASLIGIPLLQEWPSSMQWVGIVLAVLGVFWLYAPEEQPWNVFAFWNGFITERGAPFMALAALMWALGSPMDKLALRHADPSFHALYVFTGFAIAMGSWLLIRGELTAYPIPRIHWPLLAITGAFGAMAYFMQLHALQHAAAGPFEAIKRVMNQLLALALGYFLFDEKITKPKLIGIAILSIGVPLIVL